jgi:hypothetical protein
MSGSRYVRRVFDPAGLTNENHFERCLTSASQYRTRKIRVEDPAQ